MHTSYSESAISVCTPPTQNQQKCVEDCDIKGDEYIKWHETCQLALKRTANTRLTEF